MAGYVSITEKSSWSQFTPHIGWYSDYWPNTTDFGSVKGIPMVSPAFMCYTVEKPHQFIYLNYILNADHYIFSLALGGRPSRRHQLRRRPPCRLQVHYLYPRWASTNPIGYHLTLPTSPLPPRLQLGPLSSLPLAPKAQSSAVPVSRLKKTNHGSHPSKMPQSTQPGTTRAFIPTSLM